MIPKDIFKTILLECLESLNTPFSLSLFIRYENDDLSDLPSVVPSNYADWVGYYKDAQALALFSKNEFFSSDDLEAKAINEFHVVESINAKNNSQFDELAKNNHRLISDIAANVRKIVRSQPSDEFYAGSLPFFGPGATSSCRGKETTYLHKIQAKPECTTGAVDFFEHSSKGCFSRFDDYNIVNHNEFFTVPKNIKTRRACCIEPHLNTWFQRALGLDLKRRLFQSGYKLEMIPDLNASLIRGHFTQVSTLDLKQASDTIYTKIVKAVFPPVWFSLLNQARSHYTLVKGSSAKKLEKFSSMGNGFTFELETILFLAICRTVVPQRLWHFVTTYGDDILVPSEYGSEVARVLQLLGFSLNKDKTYISGVFRESCGIDVWCQDEPVNVRPVFIRNIPNEKKPTEIIALANNIRRISLRTTGLTPDHTAFRAPYKRALKLLPACFRKYGPDPYESADTFHRIPVGTRVKKKLLVGARAVFVIDTASFDKSDEIDSNGWLHCSVKNDRVRIVDIPRERFRYQNFDTRAQLCYILTGGDSQGVTPRNSLTYATTLKY